MTVSMETTQTKETSRAAYERFMDALRRMVAERKEEEATAAERFRNDPQAQAIVAELRRKQQEHGTVNV